MQKLPIGIQTFSKIINEDYLYKALKSANLEEFKNAFISIFVSIPKDNFKKDRLQNYEGFYASIFFIYLQSLGVQIIGEDVTNRGAIDLSVFIDDKIYIIEFKVNSQKGEALKQIKTKNYALKYQNQNKDIYLVGVEFDKSSRNIVHFEWEINA